MPLIENVEQYTLSDLRWLAAQDVTPEAREMLQDEIKRREASQGGTMNKTFIYCESTEGGMDTWMVYSPQDLKTLHGWMSSGCREADEQMVSWMETSEVGDYCDHRLGVMMRVKDEPAPGADEEQER